ncbi:Short-chain dehydrogenase/reductase SDR [Mycena sanguinolenta]|uniref:Short-chain dehydrogenase/reductase SDR n=1 Tax=Mycena sanguinolenta TaxID=230812 RepID=A0A8H6YM73_9AGAR|nr:Short-chain dehydrogenase/reductase SDR [Mycena sanguinolenta]
MPTTLIVGATRGLGAALAQAYAQAGHTVYATARSATAPSSPSHANITWIPGIDISTEGAGPALASALPVHTILDIVVICAGYFEKETLEDVKWGEEIKMYTTCAVGPVCVVQALVAAGKIKTAIASASAPALGKGEAAQGGKLVLISSEAGSITLRHDAEGGGNYAHHGGKAALNMVGKLLSLDLKARGVAVGIVHPGFMRTDMTKNVGYDAYWDSGGAVPPATAAASLLAFVDSSITLERSGEFWAPRGVRDIGTAEAVLGPNFPADRDAPLQLPW